MDQHQPNTGQGHAPQQQETCIWSILALIFAIVFLPFGIIFGIVALVKIKNNPNLKGKDLAIAGIVIGSVLLVFLFFLIILGTIAYFGSLNPKCDAAR